MEDFQPTFDTYGTAGHYEVVPFAHQGELCRLKRDMSHEEIKRWDFPVPPWIPFPQKRYFIVTPSALDPAPMFRVAVTTNQDESFDNIYSLDDFEFVEGAEFPGKVDDPDALAKAREFTADHYGIKDPETV